MASAPELVFLAQGKLHLVRDGIASPVTSAFAEDVRRREEEIHRRNAWKTEGTGARFLSGGLLIAAEGLAAAPPALVTSVTRGRSSRGLLYTVQVGQVGGLFELDVETQEERRLSHGREGRLLHLASPGPDGSVPCVLESADGARHLALLTGDGYDCEEVTEGDSRDEAPTWVESGRALVYQSAGIARSADGHIIDTSPYSIHRLDLDSGTIEELASHPAYDFLAPRQREDGTLFFIRRPHGPPRTSALKWLGVILLFPFRLLWAILQWLNFFTMRYTGKPLTSAEGRKLEGADARQMMIWGNLIDAARADRDARRRGEEAASLVGPEWKLVRRSPHGNEHPIAAGVLSFDVEADGGIVYTNGSAVYRRREGGAPERVAAGRFIEQVVALVDR